MTDDNNAAVAATEEQRMKLTYRRRQYPGEPEHIAPAIDGVVVWNIAPKHWTDDVQHAIRRGYVLGWAAAQQDMCRHMTETDHGVTLYGIKTTRWMNDDDNAAMQEAAHNDQLQMQRYDEDHDDEPEETG